MSDDATPQQPKPQPTYTAKDVAVWMDQLVRQSGTLYQNIVGPMIIQRFGKEFVYHNDKYTNFRVNRDVLKEFNDLNANEVVWVRKGKYWRIRLPYDPPGRETSVG